MLSFWTTIAWIVIISILISVYWYSTIPKNLPPGPRGLPLVGNWLQLFNGETQDLVIQRWVKEYGPVMRVYIGNILVLILGDYETIQEALVKQGDAFVGRVQFNGVIPEKLLRKGIVSSEDNRWKEQRRFALSVLRDLGLGRPVLESHVKEEVEGLIEMMLEHKDQPFNPLKSLVRSVCTVIYGLIFGRQTNFDRRELIVGHVLASFATLEGNQIGNLSPIFLSEKLVKLLQLHPTVREFRKQNDAFFPVMEAEIHDVQKTYDPSSPPDNYVHAYMQAQSNGQGEYFDDPDQLFATALDLFLAGTNTTSVTLQWALLFLGHNPQVQEKIYREICEKIGSNNLPNYADRTKLPYTEAVMQEIQRMANLVPFGVLRRTVAPVKLMGYDIPADTPVAPLLTNALHNGVYFAEPTKFDPERFMDKDGKVIKDPKVIPFQMGKRVCIGESLARMEIFLFVTGLVTRMRIGFPKGKPAPTLEPFRGIAYIPRQFDICVEARE